MKGKIFNAQELQSIIAGNKRMFRGVIARNTRLGNSLYFDNYILEEAVESFCPYQVGQKIFCKESFAEILTTNSSEHHFGKKIIYKAEDDSQVIWKPAKDMKREHSRLTLLIKEIRVERLADINEEDCFKEGTDYSPECCQNYIAVPDCNGNPTPSCCNNPNLADPRNDFRQLWNATHKKPEEKFEASPFVWKVGFEVINNKLR